MQQDYDDDSESSGELLDSSSDEEKLTEQL
jgi:hypothetical protein